MGPDNDENVTIQSRSSSPVLGRLVERKTSSSLSFSPPSNSVEAVADRERRKRTSDRMNRPGSVDDTSERDYSSDDSERSMATSESTRATMKRRRCANGETPIGSECKDTTDGNDDDDSGDDDSGDDDNDALDDETTARSFEFSKQVKMVLPLDVGALYRAKSLELAESMLNALYRDLCRAVLKIKQQQSRVDERCDFSMINFLTCTEMIDRLWNSIEPKDFWLRVFPIIRKLTFFATFPAPRTDRTTGSIYYDYDLFGDQRMSSVSVDGDDDDDDDSATTAGRRYRRTDLTDNEHKVRTNDSIYTDNEHKARTNDSIYSRLWPYFGDILRQSAKLIAMFTERSVQRNEDFTIMKQVCVETIFAMHIVLVVPMSVALPSRTLFPGLCYVMKMLKVLPRNAFGVMFHERIVATCQSSVQHVLALRGMRPLDLVARSTPCSVFLIKHLALALSHFKNGLIDGDLINANDRFGTGSDRSSVPTNDSSLSAYSDDYRHAIRSMCGGDANHMNEIELDVLPTSIENVDEFGDCPESLAIVTAVAEHFDLTIDAPSHVSPLYLILPHVRFNAVASFASSVRRRMPSGYGNDDDDAEPNYDAIRRAMYHFSDDDDDREEQRRDE